MDFAALISFGAAGVKKVVDFVSLVLNRQWQPAIKQIAAWCAGVGIAFVLAHSSFAAALGLSGLNVETLVVGVAGPRELIHGL